MSGDQPEVDRLCQVMHEVYEREAARVGWQTQTRSRVPWHDVPEANKAAMRKAVMALLMNLSRAGRLTVPDAQQKASEVAERSPE